MTALTEKARASGPFFCVFGGAARSCASGQFWHGPKALWHRTGAPRARRAFFVSLLASPFFSRRLLHASFPHPCRCRARHAGFFDRRRQCAADAARAGRRAGVPRRRQRRLHRRLRHQSRLRAARRRDAGGPLHRHHPESGARSRHHPGIGAGLGRVRTCSAARAGRTSPAIMSARRAARRSASASAAMCWSAAPPIRSRCNP